MKVVALIFVLTLSNLASAKLAVTGKGFKIADKNFLYKQKKIFDLTNHIMGRTFVDEQTKYAKEYNFESNKKNFLKPKVITDFLKYFKKGFLPKYKIFSTTYDTYREEAIALYHLFYYAKDFDTFYKTACWARENMNKGLFIHALTVAVLHRSDCEGILLPAPYEIYPFNFIRSDVMEKVNYYKTQGYFMPKELSELDGFASVNNNTVTIYNDFGVNYGINDEEEKLAYFTDDIGLNSYLYYYNHDYPFWMSGEDAGLHKDRRGELYYFVYQQFMARYYLERLSNGLGEIPKFSWTSPIATGFNPNMKYHNGLNIPMRPKNYDLRNKYNVEYIQEVEDYERRIRTAIDKGYITMHDGKKVSLRNPQDIENLGLFVQGNKDLGDFKFFDHLGVIAKYILGAGSKPSNKADYLPGAIEQFPTSFRDPMFHQLYSRIMNYFFRFKKNLPSYTTNELSCQGVKINKVTCTPIYTFKEDYDFDITTGAMMSKEEIEAKKEKYIFYARQKRLNHKPFSVNFDIFSDKNSEVRVMVFLGPKYDNFGNKINLDDNKYNFIELDHFTYTLKQGRNEISRRNIDFSGVAFDRTQTRSLYKDVVNSISGTGSFRLDQSQAHNGYPLRLLIPKGKKNGMKFQIFTFVTPFKPAKVAFGTGFSHQFASGVGSGARYLDDLPFGFPLDRPIDESSFFHPNMFLDDVTIYSDDKTYDD